MSVPAGSASNLNITGALTLEAWIKMNSFSGVSQAIIERYNGWPTNDGGYLLRINPSGKLVFATCHDSGNCDPVIGATTVTTTYHYNNRHQITWLQYDVSNDPTHQAQTTADAHFDYDAAGNRTSMSDGLGSATYNFNSLGQMSSEIRSFTNVGSYTLNYQYNLAGELKKITNPWNVEVSYGYDKAGRLTNVGGANYAGVTSYASGLAYRAFGAIKGMNYGDGHSLSTAYDNRLRPTTSRLLNH